MLLKKYSKNYLKNYEGMADELKKSLGKKSLKNIKILDIGCFTGDFMEILRKKGANVYGVEIQEEAAKIARKRFKNKIINKDITDLSSFSKNSFDCITMLGLVEHVKDPKKLIEIAEKILKPEGTLMIQTPNNTSLPSKITNKYWPPYTPVEHIYIFSTLSITKALEKAGFENIISKKHIKRMPFNYLYQILGTFGPEWKKLLTPLYQILPTFLREKTIPFYIGESLYFAKKKLPK
jgi:ubiquinone/menaquinone biosynthesis C-methylase UbiE